MSPTARDPAIVLIGATGYTGRIVARELGRGRDGTGPDRPPVILAARDPEALRAVADDTGIDAVEAVDVTEPSSLERLIRPGDAVINTAGPFTLLGHPVVRACVEAGAHYLDTTGEQPFMHAVQNRWDGPARDAGAAVVNAMAFEYALGDCAVAVAAEGRAPPLRAVDVIYAWGGAASSRGTRRTALRMLGRRAWQLSDSALVPTAQGAGSREVTMASGRTLRAVGFGAGEVVTVPWHTEARSVRGWLAMSGVAARIAPILAPALPFVMPLLRPLLEPLALRRPDPTAAEREASAFTIRVELEADDGARRALEVQGTDPYGLTAAIIVYGARRVLEPGAPAGVLAPAELVDPRAFLDAMAARGVRLVTDAPGPGA